MHGSEAPCRYQVDISFARLIKVDAARRPARIGLLRHDSCGARASNRVWRASGAALQSLLRELVVRGGGGPGASYVGPDAFSLAPARWRPAFPTRSRGGKRIMRPWGPRGDFFFSSPYMRSRRFVENQPRAARHRSRPPDRSGTIPGGMCISATRFTH